MEHPSTQNCHQPRPGGRASADVRSRGFSDGYRKQFRLYPEQDANALASALVPTFTRNGTFYEGDCAPYENSDTTVSFHFQASSQSKGTVYITLPLHRLLRHVDSAGQTCRLSISASSGSDYILGNYVLGHFVTIFDFGNKRVGFAPVASS